MHGNEDNRAVVLQFSLTRDDVLDAAAAQYRVVRRPWYLRSWFLVLLIAVGALGFAALVVPVVDGRFPTAAILLPLLPVVIAMVYANPRLLFRSAVRQLMRGNPSFSLPTTTTVSPAGIRSSNAMSESTVNWTQYPYYTESASGFVLFSSDRLGGVMQVLPLRGMGGGDSQPLDTLLTAHSQRLG